MSRVNRSPNATAHRRFAQWAGMPRPGWLVAGIVVLVMMPLAAYGASLTLTGSPRQVSTLQTSYPVYACMNPVADGGAGSYVWDFASNPGNHFTIDSTYGTVTPVAPLSAGDYPITVRVTDAASAMATLSVTVSVVTTPVIAMTTDTIFDNYNGSSWFCSLGILASGFGDYRDNTTWTITDASGHFGIASGYNTMTLLQGRRRLVTTRSP